MSTKPFAKVRKSVGLLSLCALTSMGCSQIVSNEAEPGDEGEEAVLDEASDAFSSAVQEGALVPNAVDSFYATRGKQYHLWTFRVNVAGAYSLETFAGYDFDELDADTKITVQRKSGSTWRTFASNDDAAVRGEASKLSHLAMRLTRGEYRVLVNQKTTVDRRIALGLFTQAANADLGQPVSVMRFAAIDDSQKPLARLNADATAAGFHAFPSHIPLTQNNGDTTYGFWRNETERVAEALGESAELYYGAGPADYTDEDMGGAKRGLCIASGTTADAAEMISTLGDSAFSDQLGIVATNSGTKVEWSEEYEEYADDIFDFLRTDAAALRTPGRNAFSVVYVTNDDGDNYKLATIGACR